MELSLITIYTWERNGDERLLLERPPPDLSMYMFFNRVPVDCVVVNKVKH